MAASPAVKFENEDFQLLLERALAEPYGLLCQCDDPARARQKIYLARQRAVRAELFDLQIRLVRIGEGNMVICKNKVLAPPEVMQALAAPSSKGAVTVSDKSAEELDL